MCTGAEIPAIVGASAALFGVKESRDARKDAKKESKRLEKEQDEATAEAQRETFSAKKRQYATQRSITRRGQSRGRASTILDKSDTLG